MEYDAAGINIYHIVLRGDAFHSFSLLLLETFFLGGGVEHVAIKIPIHHC